MRSMHKATVRVASIALGVGTLLGVSLGTNASAAAGAMNPLSLSVKITSQTPAGSACQWTVAFDATITNNTDHAVTVTDVDAGVYGNAKDYLGQALAAGDVLQPGVNSFAKVSYDGGPSAGAGCGAYTPYAPLVLTVTTDAGSVSWNESAVAPAVRTGYPLASDTTATLAGGFDAVGCRSVFFVYGPSDGSNDRQIDVTPAPCSGDGTDTVSVSATVTGLTPGTSYDDRLIVIDSQGHTLDGGDQQFTTRGPTQLPTGALGALGLAALSAAALAWRFRRRRLS